MAVTADNCEKVAEVYLVDGHEVYVDLRSGIETDDQIQAAAERIAEAASQTLAAQAAANVPGYALRQETEEADSVVAPEAQGVDPDAVDAALDPNTVKAGEPDPSVNQDPDVDATPAAEAEARKSDVDLSKVEGTGKDGRVTKADVEDL